MLLFFKNNIVKDINEIPYYLNGNLYKNNNCETYDIPYDFDDILMYNELTVENIIFYKEKVLIWLDMCEFMILPLFDNFTIVLRIYTIFSENNFIWNDKIYYNIIIKKYTNVFEFVSNNDRIKDVPKSILCLNALYTNNLKILQIICDIFDNIWIDDTQSVTFNNNMYCMGDTIKSDGNWNNFYYDIVRNNEELHNFLIDCDVPYNIDLVLYQ